MVRYELSSDSATSVILGLQMGGVNSKVMKVMKTLVVATGLESTTGVEKATQLLSPTASRARMVSVAARFGAAIPGPLPQGNRHILPGTIPSILGACAPDPRPVSVRAGRSADPVVLGPQLSARLPRNAERPARGSRASLTNSPRPHACRRWPPPAE